MLQKLNADGSGILIHYTTIFGTKFSPKKLGFLQKSTLGKHTMKNWIILWFWNIANPFKSKHFCGNLEEDVNFVKLQVFRSRKKVVGFSKLTTPKINIFLKFLKNFYSVRDLQYFKTTKNAILHCILDQSRFLRKKTWFLGGNLVPKIVR